MDDANTAVELLLADNPEDHRAPIKLSAALTLQGRLFERLGQNESARRAWERATGAIADRAEGSRDWRYLDPWARALLHLELTEQARPIVEKLVSFGYRNRDFVKACNRLGVPQEMFSMKVDASAPKGLPLARRPLADAIARSTADLV